MRRRLIISVASAVSGLIVLTSVGMAQGISPSALAPRRSSFGNPGESPAQPTARCMKYIILGICEEYEQVAPLPAAVEPAPRARRARKHKQVGMAEAQWRFLSATRDGSSSVNAFLA